jgi:hypothetical protein
MGCCSSRRAPLGGDLGAGIGGGSHYNPPQWEPACQEPETQQQQHWNPTPPQWQPLPQQIPTAQPISAEQRPQYFVKGESLQDL